MKIMEKIHSITGSRTVRLISLITIVVSAMILASACGVEDEPSTPAGKMLLQFKSKYVTGEAPEKIAKEMIDSDILPFSAVVETVKPGFLNGFDKDITGFKRGAVIAPEIGAIPFVAYIFELDNVNDTDSFITRLEDSYNLRWNVCTEADEMKIASSGNGVFIVMSPIDFDD